MGFGLLDDETYNFTVSKTGAVVIKNGSIAITSGSINLGGGNFNVTSGGIVTIKSGSIDLGNGNFTVDEYGNLSTAGKVNIGSSLSVDVNGNLSIEGGSIEISGSVGAEKKSFSVSAEGYLEAQGAKFTDVRITSSLFLDSATKHVYLYSDIINIGYNSDSSNIWIDGTTAIGPTPPSSWTASTPGYRLYVSGNSHISGNISFNGNIIVDGSKGVSQTLVIQNRDDGWWPWQQAKYAAFVYKLGVLVETYPCDKSGNRV